MAYKNGWSEEQRQRFDNISLTSVMTNILENSKSVEEALSLMDTDEYKELAKQSAIDHKEHVKIYAKSLYKNLKR